MPRRKQDECFLNDAIEKIEYLIAHGITGLKAHRDVIKNYCEEFLGRFLPPLVKHYVVNGTHADARQALIDTGKYEIGANNELKRKEDLTDDDLQAQEARRFYQLSGRGGAFRDWYPEHGRSEPESMQMVVDAMDSMGTEIGIDSVKGLYDWDSLLNGEIWEVEAGKDFDCSARSFREQARRKAHRRGMKLRSEKDEYGNLIIRAYKEPVSELAASEYSES